MRSLDADGNETERMTVGVWQDSQAPTVVADVIADDTVWTVDEGPYQINGACLHRTGCDADDRSGYNRVLRAREPDSPSKASSLRSAPRSSLSGSRALPVRQTHGAGIQFNRSREDNLLEHAVIEYGVTDDGMIGLENSQLELNHVTLAHTSLRRIRTINSSLVVRNSIFTAIALPGTPPATDNRSEHIWGRGIPSNGQWILENNVFGHTTGHNDAIDFDAPRRPNPIPIIRNNVFEGGGDDALDLTGDNYIEGNLFQNFIKDQFNVDPGESNTISASEGDFWVIRNVFANVQHASLVKEKLVFSLPQQHGRECRIGSALLRPARTDRWSQDGVLEWKAASSPILPPCSTSYAPTQI